MWGKGVLGRRNSKCKSPGAATSLAAQGRQSVCMTAVELARGEWWARRQREEGPLTWGLGEPGKDFEFHSKCGGFVPS